VRSGAELHVPRIGSQGSSEPKNRPESGLDGAVRPERFGAATRTAHHHLSISNIRQPYQFEPCPQIARHDSPGFFFWCKPARHRRRARRPSQGPAWPHPEHGSLWYTVPICCGMAGNFVFRHGHALAPQRGSVASSTIPNCQWMLSGLSKLVGR
jgi:hypothetical protein